MDSSETISSKQIPMALPMWKMFYNPIITLFENLSNSATDMESLISSILNSTSEFSDIFVPRLDINVSSECIEVLENKYYIFTLWLQGRLFYLLGYNKLSRIHNMSIEAQLKILGVLKMYQPHNYKKICKEYLNALKCIVFNVYNCTNMDFANTNTSKIILKQFFCEENVGENLDLHSIHITITTSETCKSLVIYLIRICSQIMLNEIDMKSRNITLQQICSCFIIILEKCEIDLKLTVISAYSEFLQNTGLDYVNNTNYKHFQLKNFYSCLELLLCQYKIFPNTYQEVDSLNSVLTEHFNTLCYYNGLNNFNLNVKLLRICQIIIFEYEEFIKTIPSSESINTFSEDLKKSSCYLAKIILEKHPETIKLIECYLINIDKYKSFLNLLKLAEYMVKNEVVTFIEHLKEISENKSILITDVSSTYKKMYEKIEICLNIDIMELNMIEKQCQLIEQLLNSIYLIDEEIKSWLNHTEKKINVTLKYFLSVEKFMFHMLKIFEHCCTNNVEINEITTSILNIFIYLLSIEDFSKNAEYLQTVIAIPLIPFIKYFNNSYCDIEISSASKIFYFQFIKYDFNVTIQRRCLKVLSKAISHCTSSSDVHKKIKECVYCIFKNTIDLPDYQLKNEVLLSLPYAIIYELSTPYNIITEILHLAFNSGDPVLHKTLAKVLGTIACILGGHYIIYNYPNFIDILEYRSEIICYNCDSVSSITNQKTYTFKNKNIVINRANFIKKNNYFEIMEDILIPFMKLLESTNVHIRKEMISVLPKLSTHMIRFHSVDITEKWVKCINDEEYIVRKEISVVVSVLLKNLQNTKDIDSVLKDHIYQLLIKEVISIAQQSLENQNWKLQDTVLETVNIIGLANIQNSVLISFKLLVYFLMNINSSVARIASIYLNKIASSLSMTENELYTEYKKDICKAIIEVAIINFISFKFEFTSSLQLISKAIGFSGTKEFLNNDCHHLLPYLIPWLIKVPKTISLLNDISTLMGIEIPDLLGKQFSNIYPYVRLYEKDDVSDKIMIFIEKYSKMSISSLKKRHFRVIHNELLLHYHLNSVKVMEELRSLSREEPENCDVTLVNSVQVANFLQPRFLGVLVYFDSKLMSRKVALSVKRKALQSLPEIIKLMGSNHITPLRFKVLATLRTTLTLNNGIFPQLSCNAWNAFIKNCDIESLGPLLSTIFVSLLPLLMTFPDSINDIFNYLIIKNENILREYISDLFFLLDTDVSDDIKVIVKKHMTKYEHRNCKENITFFIKYISHENVEVRTYGVKFLQKVLENNKAELDNFILGSNGLDPLIVDLLDLLVEGCRDNDESLKLACSDCIGELGAIEPSHLPRRYIQTNQSFTFSIFEDSFVINALNELTRAFQSEKHSQNMDCFALAIQEILKTYDISPESNSENGKNLWESFPDNQREIMQPLLSSRYTISPHGEQVMNIHPIFGSSNIMSFTNWINSWTNRLIQLVQSEQTRLLFQYCRPSLKRDLRSLMFFLPHILVHTLLECRPNDKILIYEEMMAVLNNNQIKKKISSSVLEYRPLKSDFLIYVPENSNVEDQMKPTKIIYMLLDYLLRWSCEWQYTNCAGKSPSNEQNYLAIHNFLSQFCKLTLAQRNYNCNEFPRAILYLENYVNENPEEFKNQLGFFARIYAELDDPDGVAGIRAIQQTEPSLEELILAHEISGQVQDAAACYERLAQKKHLKPHILQGMIRCYLDLDNPSTACHIAEGLMCSQPEYSVFLLESQAEPLWRLNQFDKLAHLLNQPELKTNRSWGVQIGRCLLHFQNGEHDLFCHEWFLTRKDIVNQLSAATLEEGAYQHGYPQIIKLHILNELKKAEHIVYRVKKSSNNLELCESIVNNLVNEWQLRSRLVQSSVRVLEPILSLRRIVLQQAKDLIPTHMSRIKQLIDLHIGKCWLESASIARKVCMHQQAYIYLLNAEQYKLKELFIEKAKLHWKRGNQEVAFNTLKRGLEEYFPDASNFKTLKSNERKIDRKLCAEAKLLIASYNEETVNLDMETNLQKYREATEVYKEWEISMVHLAQYYDKVLNTLGDDRDIGLGGDVQIHMINYFGKSLQYGCQYIYQSMPRMLSIWLDYGTRVLESKEMENYNTKYENLLKMTKLINSYLERLPSYMFLSAFSQIVSRICHPQREVYLQLKSIIVTLILKYPQQTLWMIMSVYKSSYPVRTKRCQEILQDQRLKNAVGMTTLIHDFNRLAEKLIELCNKGIGEGVHTTSVSSLVKPLPRLLASKEFSKIMMPVQKFMKLFLPSTDISLSDHNPFPNNMAYIMGIEDTVHVLPSLQRPRRITLKGSDGKKYIHMLKPKDDLRKDFRLMEFNDVVNQYLHKEAESRQRRLLIRTYSVIPLNEECGLIEWIPNLVGLRPILINIYKQKGLYMSSKELRKFLCIVKDPLEKKRQVYTEHLLPNHPPVLSEWFRHKFPDPYSWYQARTAYIRTTAVMSMVGYILGLGDRHGENILFDSTNGDTVHVDFNCLFNKGETFEWPERVPFRLTPNMVKAMGPLEVEGAFRKSCEITLRVLRTQKDILMSIVKPFVYDPLVSWPRNQPLRSEIIAERTNEQALDHVKNIETRLQGMKTGRKLPLCLSVEGHVNSLIMDATNIDNLCQMYIGWGPYL